MYFLALLVPLAGHPSPARAQVETDSRLTFRHYHFILSHVLALSNSNLNLSPYTRIPSLFVSHSSSTMVFIPEPRISPIPSAVRVSILLHRLQSPTILPAEYESMPDVKLYLAIWKSRAVGGVSNPKAASGRRHDPALAQPRSSLNFCLFGLSYT